MIQTKLLKEKRYYEKKTILYTNTFYSVLSDYLSNALLLLWPINIKRFVFNDTNKVTTLEIVKKQSNYIL